jgi:tetratricopeptide (TPR) repeat protein
VERLVVASVEGLVVAAADCCSERGRAPLGPEGSERPRRLYRAIGKSEEALESFRSAFKADPRQLESLLEVGLVHAYDLHQPEEAASAWAKLYALDPRSELAARARWEIGELGDRYPRGDGMPQDWARANALFEKRCYETSASIAISSSNRAKSTTLSVASRLSPFARIVATTFASWTCFPLTS